MSSNAYARPLTIEPGTPRCLLGIALVVHLLAAGALFLTALPAILICALCAVVAASFRLVVFRLRYFRAIVWRADGAWWLSAWNGQGTPARLRTGSVVTPLVALLSFEDLQTGQGYAVVLVPTPCNRDALRRLRVRLRLEWQTRDAWV